ncbi:hypothetical protein OIU79_015995 [Salix purpurea]|uniref:Uncharacterized protein n=2 Tax=Salix TaxID=40685 RepID=A0A9Q0PDL7_SALPP|nr:hypothetical protein OIU79_015995 [Salix purpurea]KAJ6709986.1 hypothetical protein OIU74_010985 [Salix koriyanagi]
MRLKCILFVGSLCINNVGFNGVSCSIKIPPSCFHHVDQWFRKIMNGFESSFYSRYEELRG